MQPRLQDRVRRSSGRSLGRADGPSTTRGTGRSSTTVLGASVAARERAIAWACEAVADPDVVYLDTETTGLDGQAEIVDIAVVAGDGTVLLDTLVRPARPIPFVASGVHGIRDADVAGAPTWTEVFGLVRAVVEGRRIVVYNADFDRRMVGQCCAQDALTLPDLAWQCAMLAYAEFCAEPGRGSGFKWHRLDRAAFRFGIEPGGHRARADAEVCRLVVAGMARMSAQADELGW